MNVTEAAAKYGTDAAAIWEWIARGHERAVRTDRGERFVRLSAVERDLSGAWIVVEHERES